MHWNTYMSASLDLTCAKCRRYWKGFVSRLVKTVDAKVCLHQPNIRFLFMYSRTNWSRVHLLFGFRVAFARTPMSQTWWSNNRPECCSSLQAVLNPNTQGIRKEGKKKGGKKNPNPSLSLESTPRSPRFCKLWWEVSAGARCTRRGAMLTPLHRQIS